MIAIRLPAVYGTIVQTSSMFASQSRTYYARDKVLRLREIYLIENAARPNDGATQPKSYSTVAARY